MDKFAYPTRPNENGSLVTTNIPPYSNNFVVSAPKDQTSGYPPSTQHTPHTLCFIHPNELTSNETTSHFQNHTSRNSSRHVEDVSKLNEQNYQPNIMKSSLSIILVDFDADSYFLNASQVHHICSQYGYVLRYVQ